MNRIVLPILAMALLGCTPYNLPISIPTSKTAELISFDRQRGIVTMGAPYLYLEKPDVDWGQARQEAIKLCEEWKGHKHAEPTGKTRKRCVSNVGSNCVRYALAGDYQCMP